MKGIGISHSSKRLKETYQFEIYRIKNGDIVIEKKEFSRHSDIEENILCKELVKVDQFALREYDYISSSRTHYRQNHSFMKLTVKELS